MKRKVYGITFAYIHGLKSEKVYSGRYFFKILFKGGDSPLPFNDYLQLKLSRDKDLAEIDVKWIKDAFSSIFISDGDKVGVIYDVVTGKVISVGKMKYDRWIKIRNFSVCSFSRLGVKNCSLIPLF